MPDTKVRRNAMFTQITAAYCSMPPQYLQNMFQLVQTQNKAALYRRQLR